MIPASGNYSNITDDGGEEGVYTSEHAPLLLNTPSDVSTLYLHQDYNTLLQHPSNDQQVTNVICQTTVPPDPISQDDANESDDTTQKSLKTEEIKHEMLPKDTQGIITQQQEECPASSDIFHNPSQTFPTEASSQEITVNAVEGVQLELLECSQDVDVETCESGLASKAVNKGKYFSVATERELEIVIRDHMQQTFSHFVVAKKTKTFGSTAIDHSTKFRVHWQSRDLTSTEECAVQIPFCGVPFIYVGEKAYICHLGRSKGGRTIVNEDVDYADSPKRHRSKVTKKLGCPAKIFIKQIAKFPQFKIKTNTEYWRNQTSQKVRAAIHDSDGKLDYVLEYVGTLPIVDDHANHDIGEQTSVKEPVDPLIRGKLVELAWTHGEDMPQDVIKKELDDYVVNQLFQDNTPPPKTRGRYYPSDKYITNYLYKSRLLCKLNTKDVLHLHSVVKQLQENHDERHMYLQVSDTPAGMNSIIDVTFAFQTSNQQRLLKRYASQIYITEISGVYHCTPIPLYGVFVATNVDYQLVYVFMSTEEPIKDALEKLFLWNEGWSPKIIILDYNELLIGVCEDLLPASCIIISEWSRNKAWQSWLSQNTPGQEDALYEKMLSIADAFTEEALQDSAKQLERSDAWKSCEPLRDWFSFKWLAVAKRWVAGYRQDDFIASEHLEFTLKDEVQRLCNVHFFYMKNKRIAELIVHLVESEVPQSYVRYIERNISDYERQFALTKLGGSNIPSYLQEKPATVVAHIVERIKYCVEEYNIVELQTGVFLIQDKNGKDTSHAVSFGDQTTFPSCICIDWLKFKLPCRHMLSVFQTVEGWSWDKLSPLYTSNALLNFDFSCFDKNKEDALLLMLSQNDCQHLLLAFSDKNESRSTQQVLMQCVESRNSNNTEETASTSKCVPNVAKLLKSCHSICKDLHQTLNGANENTLKKARVDLQVIMNYVKLESSIIKGKSNKTSSMKSKETTRKRNRQDMSDNKEVWIYNKERSVILYKNDQSCIIENEPLTNNIINCVQNILLKQFPSVTGLFDPSKLNEHDLGATTEVPDKRFLQMHSTDSQHWAVSGQLGDAFYVFHCEHCDKASLVEQLAELTDRDIELFVFVQRAEKNVNLCAILAVAYCVALSIGVNPQNMQFDLQQLGAHLLECLEHLSFTMFSLVS